MWEVPRPAGLLDGAGVSMAFVEGMVVVVVLFAELFVSGTCSAFSFGPALA